MNNNNKVGQHEQQQQQQPTFTHAVLSVYAMHLFQCTTNGNNNNQLSHTQSPQPRQCTNFNVQVHGDGYNNNKDTRYAD